MTVLSPPARAVESIDPHRGEVWRRFEAASPERVRAAAAEAARAGVEWRARSVRERAAVVQRLRRALYDGRHSMAEMIRHETGKSLFEALFETTITLDSIAFVARRAPSLLRPRRLRSRNVALLRKRIEVQRVPFGTVAVISPWNYPLMLPAGPIAAALAGGNAVLWKPSEFTTSVAELFHGMIREAGVPAGLVQLLAGDGATGRALLESGPDRVFFIGSEATGRKVAATCGEKLIPVSLELGGSDPAIVLEDADLGVAARGISWGRFSNSGQTCVASKRIFVMDEVHDAFVEELTRAASSLASGPGKDDVFPLIRPHQAEAADRQYRDALAKGAQIAWRADGPPFPGYFPPTILTGADERMLACREETFAPLLPVIRVRNEAEAIERANASAYGLAASVWSRNIRRARSVADRLEAGTVSINDVLLTAGTAEVPHGGLKASGFGRAHGDEGLLEATQTRTIVVDPFGGWRQVYWQPYTRRMTEGMRAFLTFAHGRGLISRAIAGLKAVRLLYTKW